MANWNYDQSGPLLGDRVREETFSVDTSTVGGTLRQGQQPKRKLCSTICYHFSYHLTSLLNISIALGLLVSIPLYTDFYAVVKSDSFSALHFVVAISTLVLGLLTLMSALRKLCNRSVDAFDRCSKLTVFSIVRDSFIFTISLLCLAYCRDQGRIPCNLQDGVLFLAIPVAIIYMTLSKRKGNVSDEKVKLIVCLTVFMGGVFLATLFQLSYRFTCRGVTIPYDPEMYSLTKKLWMADYLTSIALFTCCLIQFLSRLQEHNLSSSICIQRITWVHISVFFMLLALFWTDIFPVIGGTVGVNEFWTNFSMIWGCHFTNECASPAKLGFVIAAFWLLLLLTSGILLFKFQSNPVIVICNACLALPLLPIFYDLFQPDLLGVTVRSTVSVNGITGICMFVSAYTCLAVYRREQKKLTVEGYFDIF